MFEHQLIYKNIKYFMALIKIFTSMVMKCCYYVIYDILFMILIVFPRNVYICRCINTCLSYVKTPSIVNNYIFYLIIEHIYNQVKIYFKVITKLLHQLVCFCQIIHIESINIQTRRTYIYIRILKFVKLTCIFRKMYIKFTDFLCLHMIFFPEYLFLTLF